MTMTLMEGSVNAIKDYLGTNMSAKLDVLDAEYDDGVTLEDIANYYIAETLAIPAMPAIYVLGNRSEIPVDGPTHIKGSHHITVAVLATDPNNENLRKRLYRYVRAILELMREARDDTTFENAGIVFDSCEFSPMYGRGGTFLQDARVELHLAKIETE